jgi:hypothetical protein
MFLLNYSQLLNTYDSEYFLGKYKDKCERSWNLKGAKQFYFELYPVNRDSIRYLRRLNKELCGTEL